MMSKVQVCSDAEQPDWITYAESDDSAVIEAAINEYLSPLPGGEVSAGNYNGGCRVVGPDGEAVSARQWLWDHTESA